ncbi:hypothetical protein J1N09_10065 [Aureitalea sp. L0-47]|uniref:hypothetical protein n=1 Tax=Aureitalea sp. L0-47 TaxID=2816962 RepID=UPI0022374E42|nr:hypothetical protein [Aureitalea sp. L0-47]MCW5520183.1 hypothetical protein [Aureitalea sp. L0-47]
MNSSFSIELPGLSNLNDFVNRWSPVYSFKNEHRYRDHIDKVLDNKSSFIELFKWKNGTGDVIYEKKMTNVLNYWKKVEVLKYLKTDFDWEIFESEFEPQKSSTIWRLFLLHIMNPSQFPIFDQHVFRSYKFITKGVIEEIPNNSKKKYLLYKNEYFDWFNNLKQEYNESPKKMDESFFSFGQMLKGIKKYPINIEQR